MPIYEFECLECGARSEKLCTSEGDFPEICEICGSKDVQKCFSLIGGYSGDLGTASTRPKNAGSFK